MTYHRVNWFKVNLSIRARIIILALVCMVPIAGLEIYSAREHAAQDIAQAQERVRLLAQKSNAQYDNTIVQTRTILENIALSPDVQAFSQPGCDQLMRDVNNRNPWMTGTYVLRLDGSVACSSHSVLPNINISARDYFRKALATRAFTVSGFHIGVVSNKPIISGLMPIIDKSGTLIGLAGTSINLDAFNIMLADHEKASDYSILIVDANGIVIGRYPDAQKFLGMDVSATSLNKTAQTVGTGEIETVGLAGDRRIFAFQPFADTTAYIAVGVPRDPIVQKINHSLYRNLVLIALLIAMSGGIGCVVAETLIVRPARQLTGAALALGRGEFNVVPDIQFSMPEMHRLLLAFRGTARQLHEREAELKKSEAAAMETNRTLLLAEQMANAGNWRVDYPHETVTWSDNVYRIFGRSPAAFETSLPNIIGSIHPDDRTDVIQSLEMAYALQRDFEHTIRILRPDGEIRYCISRGFCEIGSGGQVSSLFGVIVDITQLKAAEEELKAARQLAEAANHAKSEFLSSVSHELRTPLTSVIGFADLMLRQEPSKQIQRYLTLQRDAGHHLMKLINDLLDHSKIEAGKLDLEAIPFDIRALINSCVEVMMLQATRKGLELDSVISVTIPEILVGDPARLKQVILNLLGNALKFTSTGHVALKVDLTGVASDVVALRFEVRDTGPGIPADKLEGLFQRFAQASVSTARQFGGTGLGLSISKQLVEAMGGSIGVESRPGVGSCFWFNLRLLSASANNLPQMQAAGHGEQRSNRILLADDSAVNQVLFSEILTSLGHRVVTVGNGAEALEAVQHESFDLILMDMQMPVMDGVTATQAIRALSSRTPPIIGLTASAMKEDIDRCFAAGMNGHVAKPVDIATLAEVIEKMTA